MLNLDRRAFACVFHSAFLIQHSAFPNYFSPYSFTYFTHSFTSGRLFSILYSYSMEMFPSNPWFFSSSRTPLMSDTPVPKGTSWPFGENSLRSLKWLLITRPWRIFKASIGLMPERTQWPISAHEPIR